MRITFTRKSGNKKTGPMPVSMTEERSCPKACPLYRNGCYARSWPLVKHWDDLSSGKTGIGWAEFIECIKELPRGILWRHNQAGDLPHTGDRATIDARALSDLTDANSGARGFTYTHYDPTIGDNAKALADANTRGFTVNLSGNNLKHADKLAAINCGPVVTVLPAEVNGNQVIKTPAGNNVVVCPATYRDDVTCASCGLCARANRKVIVGFPAHGTSARKASAIASA